MFANIKNSIDFLYLKLYNWSRKNKRAECKKIMIVNEKRSKNTCKKY